MSEEWDTVIAVRRKGHFTVTKFAAQVFRQQRSGRIVNTSSEAGLGAGWVRPTMLPPRKGSPV